MPITPFCNNLRDGDPVLDVESNRPAKVVGQPRESSVNVKVQFQGTNSTRYVPLAQLRLIVDGKAEDCAPHDGEIPAPAQEDEVPPARRETKFVDPRDAIKARRQYLQEKMAAMNEEFKGYREEAERLDAALKALG